MGGSEDKKSGSSTAEKIDDGPPTLVLKIDLHCEGCVKKIKRTVRNLRGVDDVKVDPASDKLTVIGKVDPVKVKVRLEEKLHKKVDILLLSSTPQKDAAGGGDDKKPKEAPVSTHKIKRIISKIKGITEEEDGEDGGGSGVQEKEGFEEDEKKGEESKMEVSKMEYHGSPYGSYSAMRPVHNQGYIDQGYGLPVYNQGYVNPGYVQGYVNPGFPSQGFVNPGYVHPGYNQGYVGQHSHPPQPPPPPPPLYMHAPQMFSDENPNACSVM